MLERDAGRTEAALAILGFHKVAKETGYASRPPVTRWAIISMS